MRFFMWKRKFSIETVTCKQPLNKIKQNSKMREKWTKKEVEADEMEINDALVERRLLSIGQMRLDNVGGTRFIRVRRKGVHEGWRKETGRKKEKWKTKKTAPGTSSTNSQSSA